LLDRFLLPIQRCVVGAHGPANGELRKDRGNRQPVQRLGDDPVTVPTIGQSHFVIHTRYSCRRKHGC